MVRENGMVMISEEEYRNFVRESKTADCLRSAIVKLMKKFKENPTEDVELTRKEFIATFNAAVDDMFKKIDKDNSGIDDNEIYGYNVTVHWHGFSCNCEDGAEIYNHLIGAIEVIDDEIGDDC